MSCSEAALSFDLISDCVLQSTIIVNLDDPQASDIMLQNEAEFGKDSARGCSRSRQGRAFTSEQAKGVGRWPIST